MKLKCFGTGPTVFRPYTRRLQSLADIRAKAALLPLLFKDPKRGSGWKSNPGLPVHSRVPKLSS